MISLDEVLELAVRLGSRLHEADQALAKSVARVKELEAAAAAAAEAKAKSK